MPRHRYLPSDALLDVNVSVEELEVLREDLKALGKDTEALDHLFVRIERTLIALNGRLKAALRSVEMAMNDTGAGRPTSLDPIDALRYIPPDRLKEAVGAMARSQLAVYEQVIATAQAERAQLQHAANQAKAALATLADVPMDDATRSRLAAAWAALDLPPAPDLPAPADIDPDIPAPAMRGTNPKEIM